MQTVKGNFMIRVLVYSNNTDIKKKVFRLLPLLKEYNFYFLADSKDFADDFNSVKPEYLILEAQIFETLRDDAACFDINPAGRL